MNADDSYESKRRRWIESGYPAFWTGFTPLVNEVLLGPYSCDAKCVYALLENLHRRANGEDVSPTVDEARNMLNITIRRWRSAVQELVDSGLLTVKRRGQGLPSVYRILPPPDEADVTFQERPEEAEVIIQEKAVVRQPRARASKLLEQEDKGKRIEIPPIHPRTPSVVNRVAVTGTEAELSILVLDSWNAQANQKLASKDWLAKIVMRIREHPELDLPAHANVIGVSLANPWWQGPANPSVVYGSGAQFERCLLRLDAPSRSNGSMSADDLMALASQLEAEDA